MLSYPPNPQGDVVDTLHGVDVPDPWRWLEELDSLDTKSWVEAQNTLAESHLACLPERSKIRARLEALWHHERYGVPRLRGDRTFFLHNNGSQEQYVLCWTEGEDDTQRVLLDPNTFSDDGTVSLSAYNISNDGRLLAYGLSDGGSDWTEWRVRDIDTGKEHEDRINWVKFSSASWAHDNQGFFYSRYDAPSAAGETYKAVNQRHKLYYHQLGTPQSDDRLIYARPDQKSWILNGDVTQDGRYLIIDVRKGSHRETGLFYKEMQNDGAIVELLSEFDAGYTFLGNEGSVFYIMTDLDAPMSRLIAIDVEQPERSAWKEIIPESTDTLNSVQRVGDQWFAHYLHHAHSNIQIFALDGAPLGTLALPEQGSVVVGSSDGTSELYYALTGFKQPTTIFRYKAPEHNAVGVSSVFKSPNIDFDPDAFVAHQVFYTSRDGTRVSMFLTHKKDVEPNGDLPTYMYGYGGFNKALTPFFSMGLLVWMEMGGVVAIPNLRGGGEYGKRWHKAGTKLQKQNVFEDFTSAAQWLFDHGWTSPSRLAIAGGSNGGLLVGACMTQRPEMFGACLPAVGVMDMLRFPYFTIGRAWVSDYGSPENPEEFKALLAYSPYHNTKPGTHYPATLITTGDHDDRVFPAHSFKFAAALQTAQGGDPPILIRIETRAGHGAGTATSKVIDQLVDRWSFLAKHLNMDLGAWLNTQK